MKEIKTELRKKGFDPDLYHCWVNVEDNSMTVPLYSYDGRWVGYQKYSPNLPKKGRIASELRYFTHTSEEALWGLDTIDLSKGRNVYVTEAVFRSVALHKVGLNSISILGSSCSKRAKKIFKECLAFNYIWVGDPDKSGERAINYFTKGFVSPKDLDEMSLDELTKFKLNILKD